MEPYLKLTTQSPLPTSQWTHLACTNDAATLTLWIDGVAQGSTAGASIATDGTDGTALGMNSPSGDHFIGLIDDVRISRVARAAPDICPSASPACTP